MNRADKVASNRIAKVKFLTGVLVGSAASRQLMLYDVFRRLGQLSYQQMGEFLEAIRAELGPGEPDLSALVIKTIGRPGVGWGNVNSWEIEVQKVWDYWTDRSTLDNEPFVLKHGSLPVIPGTLA